MRKKIFILILSIISVVCFAAGVSACAAEDDYFPAASGSLAGGSSTGGSSASGGSEESSSAGDRYSALEMQSGIVYLTDYSVKYTGEDESPYGELNESALAEEKSGTDQSYYLVLEFDMQMASGTDGKEWLTVELTTLDASVVTASVNSANTSSTSVVTADGQTTVTAMYSLPDKAKLIKSAQLVIELKPESQGATDIVFSFSADEKTVTGYSDEDCFYSYTGSSVTVGNSSLEYALNDGGASYSVTGFGEKSGVTYIRDTYKGLPVTAIGDSAFAESSVTAISIPDSVTSIGAKAFYNCASLANVTIGSGVTEIGNNAFGYCTSLTEVVLPDGIISVGSYAFRDCDSLYSITIPDGVTQIGNNVFYGCSSLASATLPASAISYIPQDNLKSVSVTSGDVESYAFEDCASLESVTLSADVTRIGNNAFTGCTSLKNVYYGGTASQWASVSFESGDANPLYYAGNLYLDGALASDIELQDITTIKAYAFNGCTSITTISIPDSVTSIGACAFSGCTSLASITIPDGVTAISEYMLYNCRSLFSLAIPDGVTRIGDNAFSGCSSLKNVSSPARVISYIPLDSLTSVVISSGDIGSYAFEDCSSLESVTIGSGVTSIGNYAFSGCAAEILWADNLSITEINSYTFANYGGTSITLPEGVLSVGDYAFNGCASLVSVIIPASVTKIGNCAFRKCDSLESVTFVNASGWHVTAVSGDTSGGSPVTVTDAEANAANFTGTYLNYYWYRSEN